MDRILATTAALAVSLAVGAVVVAATAGPEQPDETPALDRRAADVVPDARRLQLSRAARVAAKPAKGPTVEEVGDVDSFGRKLTWLGVTNAFLELAPTCDPTSGTLCQPLAGGSAVTPFNFTDAVRIELPKDASKSLLCYWFSPVLTVNYANPTASPVVARLNYNPTLTVENPVLADPALIDPSTGAPFGGRLETGMTSSESFQVPLPAGLSITERTRDSAVCIAGFINRRNLIDGYGLTPAQADEFFRQPTTVRLNVRGSAQYVGFASLVFGLRIIGD
ncbi:hypothetical protein [Lysobacter humi (ex Lee et al. 2017)]